jgi:beta-lactamase class A
MPAGGFAAQMQQAIRHIDARGRMHVAAWELGVHDGKLLIQGEEVVPAASTIKVPILAAVLKEVGTGRLKLERPMPIPTRRAGGSGVVQALTGLVSLTLADLLTLMIIVSDNAATNVIIELLGMDHINAFCTEQGLAGTVLRRQMMDAEATSRGLENTTTALDQAKLLDAVAQGALLAEPLRTFALQTLSAQQFTDALPSLLPDSVQVAHKTGELPGVRHDVGIITAANGRRAVVSVLFTGLDGGMISPRAGEASPVESPQSLKVSAGTAIAAVGYAAWRALDRSV